MPCRSDMSCCYATIMLGSGGGGEGEKREKSKGGGELEGEGVVGEEKGGRGGGGEGERGRLEERRRAGSFMCANLYNAQGLWGAVL